MAVKARAELTLASVSDGKPGATGPAGPIGPTGKPGSNGVGIKSTAISYQAGASQTTAPTGTWTANPPKLSTALPYLWTKTAITYTDGKTSTSYSVSSTIDGVEVGGKNYVRNKNGTKSDTINGITVEYLDNEFHIYGTNTHTEGAYGVGTWIDQDGIFAKGETWTFSVDKPLPDGMYLSLNSWVSDGSYQIGLGSINSDWNKASESVTFAIPENCNLNATGFFGFYGRVKEIDITIRIKLEKGNKATDWTPAPEDVQQDIDHAQTDANTAGDKADSALEAVTKTSAELKILNDSISSLVTDAKGQSLMTQTGSGWTFNVGSIQSALNGAIGDIQDVKGDINGVNDLANKTNALANDLAAKTAYINMTQDASGKPVMELGQQNGEFKLRITNTSMDFMQGSQRIAYLSNRQLYIQSSVVTDEMKIGATSGYIWKKRANGNMGLRYITS